MNTTTLPNMMRRVPSEVMTLKGRRPVVSATILPAGHSGTPINPAMPCLALKTTEGTRYYGVVRGYISARLNMIIEIPTLRFEEMAAWDAPELDEIPV